MCTEVHDGKVVMGPRGPEAEERHGWFGEPRDDPHAQHGGVEGLGPVPIPDLEHDVTESLHLHGNGPFRVAGQTAAAKMLSLSSTLMGGPIGLRSCEQAILAS